jgi:hypothetical protein
MKLQKTEKARAELTPGVRNLGQRERTFLLLADGERSLQDIAKVLQGEVDTLAQKLINDGYVQETSPAQIVLPRTRSKTTRDVEQGAKPAPKTVTSPQPEPPAVSADSFEGRRSLATTRMFLFDICERMFARRAPVMAEQFREALRNARDRESMLAASRDMIDEIEKVAGHERADSISERIAMLLPPEY